jgi:hypothetical protein
MVIFDYFDFILSLINIINYNYKLYGFGDINNSTRLTRKIEDYVYSKLFLVMK